MKLFNWFKGFFTKKEEKKLSVFPPLVYDIGNNNLSVNIMQIAASLASSDIYINNEGKLELSNYYNDDKTQFFEFVNDVSILKEDGKDPVLVKTIQRLTLYRNEKGNLINIEIGQPIKVNKKFYS
jgi:hypothetical protein